APVLAEPRTVVVPTRPAATRPPGTGTAPASKSCCHFLYRLSLTPGRLVGSGRVPIRPPPRANLRPLLSESGALAPGRPSRRAARRPRSGRRRRLRQRLGQSPSVLLQSGAVVRRDRRLQRMVERLALERRRPAAALAAEIGAASVALARRVDHDRALERANHPQQLALGTAGSANRA